eukprot:1193559-Prorocentrum_minimum.AAC.1
MAAKTAWSVFSPSSNCTRQRYINTFRTVGKTWPLLTVRACRSPLSDFYDLIKASDHANVHIYLHLAERDGGLQLGGRLGEALGGVLG